MGFYTFGCGGVGRTSSCPTENTLRYCGDYGMCVKVHLHLSALEVFDRSLYHQLVVAILLVRFLASARFLRCILARCDSEQVGF